MRIAATINKVRIIIDWVPSNYGAAVDLEGVACVATGKTLPEVKENIVDALKFHVQGLREDAEAIPSTLDGEWEPEFILSTRAQLKYVDNFITRKALATETGIAEQQLSHYANGQRHPRPEMQKRITAGIRAICNHLAVVL